MSIQRPVIEDDDSTGSTGTVLDADAAFFRQLLDYIDECKTEAKTAAVEAKDAERRITRGIALGGLDGLP